MKLSESIDFLSFDQLKTLIADIDGLSDYGLKLSNTPYQEPLEFLIQEARLTFIKTMMSLQAFLRFIPSSRFHANQGGYFIDLSSACVMARQVIVDSILFFYLSEPGLTKEEKEFRELVWLLHGQTEALDFLRLINVSRRGYTSEIVDKLISRMPEASNRDELKQRLSEPRFETRLRAISEERRRKEIRIGRQNYVLNDREILSRRGIQFSRYKGWKKALSNCVHFSAVSRTAMMLTSNDWTKSWEQFVLPAVCAANFGAEAIEVFLETFPQSREFLTKEEQAKIVYLRS